MIKTKTALRGLLGGAAEAGAVRARGECCDRGCVGGGTGRGGFYGMVTSWLMICSASAVRR